MTRKPAFSICLLTHNSAAYIQDSMKSVMAQTWTDWECLVCDDASEDDTVKILQGLSADPRITVIQHPRNLGQAENWASAIRAASGKWIATLHADDAWDPDFLGKMSAVLERGATPAMAWANFDYYDGTLRAHIRPGPVRDAHIARQELLPWLVLHNHTLPSATCFASELAKEAGLPTNACGIFCDREYFLRIASKANSGAAVGASLVRYRQHESSTTSASARTGQLERETLMLGNYISRWLVNDVDAPALATCIQRESAQTVMTSAVDAALRGDFPFAVKWIASAIRHAGLSILHWKVMLSICRVIKARLYSS